MHHAHSGITVPDLVAQDADSDQVVDVVEVAAPDDHLLIDRPIVLGPCLDHRVDLGRVEGGDDLGAHLGEVGVSRRRSAGDQPHDLLVLLGMQDRKRQILQFPLDRRHPQPMCQRRNDFQCFAGLAGLLLRRQEAHRPHVVQPVGDLDHQHPRIARHGGDHLADRLAFGGAAQHHPVQLGHAVDKMADLFAEIAGQCIQCVAGVLDGVMQQGGHQRGGVHAQLGEDVGHRQRVGDVRVPGVPQLSGVPLLGDLIGPLQQRQVGLRVDLAVHRHQWFEHRAERAALRRHPPRQPGPNPTRGAAGRLEADRGLGRRRLGGGRLGERRKAGDLQRFGGRLDRRPFVVRHFRHLRRPPSKDIPDFG